MTTAGPTPGLAASVSRLVTEADTAASIGSGSLAVLATPVVVGWLEAASCAAIAASVPPGSSSVGTRLTIEHVRASAVGASIECRATLTHVDGRLLRFEVVALAADGQVVAHGDLTRVVVDDDRFLARVST